MTLHFYFNLIFFLFSIKQSFPLLKYDWSEFGFGSGESRDMNSREGLQLYVSGLNKVGRESQNVWNRYQNLPSFDEEDRFSYQRDFPHP